MSDLLTFKTNNNKSKLFQQFNQMKTSSKDTDYYKIKITTEHNELILDINRDLYKSFSDSDSSFKVSSSAGKTETAVTDKLQ